MSDMTKERPRKTRRSDREPVNPDRHKATFMMRFPEEIRGWLQEWQDLQEKLTRVRPDMVDGAKLGILDFLGTFGIGPHAGRKKPKGE